MSFLKRKFVFSSVDLFFHCFFELLNFRGVSAWERKFQCLLHKDGINGLYRLTRLLTMGPTDSFY